MSTPEETPARDRDVRIRGGADATDVAAIIAALDTDQPRPHRTDTTPPWMLAGRLEALGHAPAAAPGDLTDRPG